MKDFKLEHVMRVLSDQNLENILNLIEVFLALPPTSIKCEKVFSAMKLSKTNEGVD